MDSLVIRKASEVDVPAIHALVVELATYEKAAEQVSTSVEEYIRDFKDKHFEAIVAEADGHILGVALYYMAYSTWKGRMLYLDDFIVTRSHRQRGIGQILFDAFLAEARLQQVRLVKWQVLDWNKPAIAFYKKNNAILDAEWLNGRYFLRD